MSLEIEIQYAAAATLDLPTPESIRRWVEAALAGRRAQGELTVRLVEREESALLNRTYRGKPGPTNVLSFTPGAPGGVESPGLEGVLGDIVICAPLVAQEAGEQGKPVQAHWAHLVVHGVLHLLGYDHETPAEAAVMESLETEILGQMGYSDPYVVMEDASDERRPT